MRRDSVSAARPYVFIREFKWSWLHDPNNEQRIVSWRVTPIWENSGNTVARKVNLYVSPSFPLADTIKWRKSAKNVRIRPENVAM